ncbi:hypothetical protein [Frankia sp. R82]|uniref:hypothetical protein n=1 Tax=Frankia sp. R82 TaxID=2950553 RepID=UPI0020432A2F|nr:hypothetical protein [Frankia sp. R82]MCM3885174.1 hypothetical protein [Frankia sp. R82]
MRCPFSTQQTTTKTATISKPAGPPVAFYVRITTHGHRKSLDDQHAQTLTYLTAHHPASHPLHEDSREPVRTRFSPASICRRVLPRHQRGT